MENLSLLFKTLKLKLFVLIVFFSCSNKLLACDFALNSFEIAVCNFEYEEILTGEIIEQGEQYIDFKIIENLRGCEEQSVIRIWDAPIFWCNGPFAAPVSEYGIVGDSIICITQKIDTILTSWDVIGDYRRPIIFNYVNYMKIQNNQVIGYDTIPYQNYVNQLDNDCMEVDCQTLTPEDCADSSLNCNDLELSLFPNPVHEKLRFFVNSGKWDKFCISDIIGKTVLNGIKGEDIIEIDINNLSQGVYIFSLIEGDNVIIADKFIKQ